MDLNVFILLAFLIGFCHAERALMDYPEFAKRVPYKTEPITISCFFSTDNSHMEGKWMTVNHANDLKTMALEMAHTAKGLSMYFDYNGSKLTEDAAKKWHFNSGTNICTFSYRLSSGTGLTEKEKEKEEEEAIVMGYRLELLAFKSMEVFRAIQLERTNLLPQGGKVDASKDLKVVGLGHGAHAAALFCRYVLSHFEAACLFLLGLDPTKVVPGISRESLIRRLDAVYVQLIYTSLPLQPIQSGDATIIVVSNCMIDSCGRLLVFQMHEQISAGELTMYTK